MLTLILSPASTSERFVLDMRRPDWRTPMKVLVKKTFNFVGDIWRTYMYMYIHWKVTDLRWVRSYASCMVENGVVLHVCTYSHTCTCTCIHACTHVCTHVCISRCCSLPPSPIVAKCPGFWPYVPVVSRFTWFCSIVLESSSIAQIHVEVWHKHKLSILSNFSPYISMFSGCGST